MITLRQFRPDDADWVTRNHAELYAREEGFDDTFGPLVAGILADFIATHHPARERGWIAEEHGQRLGCIFCVRPEAEVAPDVAPQVAKLRLFLVHPEARGKGLGHHLLTTCLGFARDTGATRMTLWTHESHRAACALYARHGFTCTRAKPVHSFGVDLVEQAWEIAL